MKNTIFSIFAASFPWFGSCCIATAKRRWLMLFALAVTLLLGTGIPSAFADADHNPIGTTGVFEGMVTTGGAYNVLSHNARREIDDIVVPGAVGKYGLKMTRYYNSRSDNGYPMGPGWSHEYLWTRDQIQGRIDYPNGGVFDGHCTGDWGLEGPLGVSDWPTTSPEGYPAFRLADGGMVVFGNPYVATKIVDPYGQVTTITVNNLNVITQVTEPGGRYLKFFYGDPNVPGLPDLLTRVEAHGLGNATVTDSVVYHYQLIVPGGHGAPRQWCLTQVDYSDGQQAHYTYQRDNAEDHPQQPCPCSIQAFPLVSGFDDVRYRGPMRRIAYQYQGGPHGAILQENYWDGVPGHEGNGPMVSRIDPPVPSPLIVQVNFNTLYTEYRGDGSTRRFTYTPLHLGRPSDESCPRWQYDHDSNPAPQQLLRSYTDFKVPANSTQLGYDANWYVNSVTDANNHTITYLRGPDPAHGGIGQILRITHPGGSHFDYVYRDESPNISGHYVQETTNERGAITHYFRDSSSRVTRIDYKDSQGNILAYEQFTSYNGFGQLLTHRLKNGAWESFVYDGRGLLTDKYNPKFGGAPGGNDPHTHYSYYTSGAWTDRIQTITLPVNTSGYAATETFEYDRTLSGGVTDPNGTPVAGRGLVTKITHTAPDNKYQTFKYDAYGNKTWEDNELRKITQYSYDDYNRLLSVTDPLYHTETFSYLKPGTASSYLHTTNSIYTHTSRAGIVTANVYDSNWRKTSTTTAEATTRFAYDNVGNLIDTTDPRNKVSHNGYDNRNRKTSTTEAYGIPGLAATTVWHYNAVGSIFQIDRPDGKQETKGYDALNRMTWHTVPKQIIGGGQVNVTTTIYYNPSGTVEHVRDARAKVTLFDYNASDEKIQMTYHDGSYQKWSWDDAHNLASRTTVRAVNPRETQSFSYDNRNRKTGMSWSNNADWATYGYDSASHLTSAENANSTVTRQYDADGHLTLDQQSVSGLGSAKSVNYPPYDGDGRVTGVNVTGASYNYSFGYDAMGRFETILTGGSVKFQYAYDAASNETDRSAYFNNVTIDQIYGRDSLNRMSSRLLKRNGQSPAFSSEAYTYDHMNRLTEVNRDGAADGFAYYWTSELMSAQYGGGPQMPFNEGQDPDLDTADTVDPNAGYQPPETPEIEPPPPADDTSLSDETPDTTPSPDFTPPNDTPPAEDPAKEQKTVEDYLGDSQLGPPDGPGQDFPDGRNVTYNLDKAGNRTSVTDNVNGNASYAPNNLNQYTSVGGSSVTNGPEHEIQTYNNVRYDYINDEHLKQVTSGSNTYNLYYDALGRCVKRVLNGATTYYIYDGEKPILEYRSTDPSHPAKNLYGKGIDEILMRYDPSFNPALTYYYQHDHEGSVTHLLDTSGNVIESYKYDAFGAPAINDRYGNPLSSSAYSNRFLFTGREYANLFGFYEYRARAYHPGLGRFMSEDPKGFDAGDYNLFRYCHNDPIDLTDPMGLDAMANAMAVAEVVVPGQYEYNQMVANFQAGNYGTAAGWGVTMAASTVAGVLTATSTTRLQAGLRAAESAAARRTVAAVIGKYKDIPSYKNVGQHLNAKYHDIPVKIWEKMSAEQRQVAQEKFLNRALARGGDFLFNKPIKSIESQSGEFRRELEYVSQKDFVLSRDGWSMTRDAATAARDVPLPLKP